MSNLKRSEQAYFEKLFGMSSGYVLDYSDRTFETFFEKFNIEIHSEKYQKYGTSKAKKLRAFWDIEEAVLVGKVLKEMLDAYKAYCIKKNSTLDNATLEKAEEIVKRLLNGKTAFVQSVSSDDEFLKHNFQIPALARLPVEATLIPIIERRLSEAEKTLRAQAYLSTIFLCGSVLEAILLGAARQNSKDFNQMSSAPKDNAGKVKHFHDWTLADLINVATQTGLLKPDTQKFSHGLRDFRNYIHPYMEMMSGFTPDEYTARLCFQALKAALASVAGDRK